MKKRVSVLVLAVLLVLMTTVSPALAQQGLARVAGEVLAVGLEEFTLKPLHRDAITVQVTAETQYYRKVELAGMEPISFGYLQTGDRVNAAGTWDGQVFLADTVVVVPAELNPPLTIHGSISALDSGNGSLTLDRPGVDVVTVQTSGETEFYRTVQHGRLEPIAFVDLAAGDWVRVHGTWESGIFNARRVVVMPFSPPPPPRLVTGSIGALDAAGTFTLEHRYREAMTVKTEATTRFYRTLRWGQLEPIGFGDLVVGDWVTVLGSWDGEALVANKVIVMRGHGDEAEGVLEAGEVMEAEEVLDVQISPEAQP